MTDRVLERLERLYAIGGGPGANRPALSAAEEEACALAAGWMAEAGLEVVRDPVGNLVGRLRGRRPALPEIWTGSHLDTVPAGGRFDGALGVVAGLEAIERIGRQERTLAVVSFRDEEGWRFGRGCFGSRALCGRLEEGELDARDAGGVSVREAIEALGSPGEPQPLPGAYVEIHVEQGTRLASAGAPLGVVTSIVGLVRTEVELIGAPGHAGTTPMAGRDDALVKAAEVVLAVREAAVSLPGAVATVGRLTVEPGAPNVIPGRVTLTVDARAPDAETFDRLTARVPGRLLRRAEPSAMAPEVRAVLREELERLGLPVVELHSGAGHDAGVLAAAGVPSGMLFVRSLAGGVSHSPEESSSPEDVALAVDVLAGALRRLASSSRTTGRN